MERIVKQLKKSILLFLIKRRFRRLFKAGKKFRSKSKQLFLSEFEKKFPPINSESGRMYHRHVFRYGLFSFLALLFLSASAFVYADQKNVGADHPLYGIKILGETIQLTFSPEKNKSDLNYKFAQRRLQEIREVKEKEQDSIEKEEKKIDKLSDEFDDSIDDALDKIDKIEDNPGSISNPEARKNELCDSISQAINDYKQTISSQNENEKDLRAMDSFADHCGKSL